MQRSAGLLVPLLLVCLATLSSVASAAGESDGGGIDCKGLEQALELDCAMAYPTSPDVEAYNNAGRAMERAGEFRRALALYTEAIAKAQRPIELFFAMSIPEGALRHRGIVHRELGEFTEALADFGSLIDADKGNANARNERARTLLELHRVDEALADSDLAVWLAAWNGDFHALRAEILTALGRHEEAEAALAEADKAKRMAARPIWPVSIRQRFMLQRSCPEDDRHVLTLAIEDGRVVATPSYVGAAGTMTVETTGDRLLFTMGAEPCRIRVAIGKGDLPIDAPPVADDALRTLIGRHATAQPVRGDFYSSPTLGCARGTMTVRAYWGSVDHWSQKTQNAIRAHLGAKSPPRSKQLRATYPFGSESCRISVQIWKGS